MYELIKYIVKYNIVEIATAFLPNLARRQEMKNLWVLRYFFTVQLISSAIALRGYLT